MILGRNQGEITEEIRRTLSHHFTHIIALKYWYFPLLEIMAKTHKSTIRLGKIMNQGANSKIIQKISLKLS